MKQENLEEFIESQPYYGSCTTEYLEGIEIGAKWQQKRMYSEEEVKQAYTEGGFAQLRYIDGLPYIDRDRWFEQFKKK